MYEVGGLILKTRSKKKYYDKGCAGEQHVSENVVNGQRKLNKGEKYEGPCSEWESKR